MSNMNEALGEMIQRYRQALDAIVAYRCQVPLTTQDIITIKRIAREAIAREASPSMPHSGIQT